MFVKQLLYVRPPYSAYHEKRPGFSAVINKGIQGIKGIHEYGHSITII